MKRCGVDLPRVPVAGGHLIVPVTTGEVSEARFHRRYDIIEIAADKFYRLLQGPETVRETQMHELSIAIDLLAAVEQKLRPGDNRVVRVIVSVGSATGIAPESLCLAFRAIAVGTRVEGTELTVTNTAARSRCVDCGMIFDFEGVIGQCPGCGRLGGKILCGDEVMLRAIEVADV